MKLILLALALGSAAPALPSTSPRAQPEAAAPTVAEYDQQLAAFGAWLIRLQAAMDPVQRELGGMGAAWQQAMQGGGSAAAADRMRPVITRALAAVDQAERELGRLDTPSFPLLELPADLQTAALRGQSQELAGRTRQMVQSFTPMMDAVRRNDARAGAAAVGGTMDSVGLVLDAQMLILRAGMATTDTSDPAWHDMNVRLLFTRAGARAVAAFPRGLTPRRQPAFPAELRTIADEMDATARDGSVVLEQLIADLETDGHDPEAETLVRRTRAVLLSMRPLFPLANDMARLMRATAADGDLVSVERVGGFMFAYRQLKERLDALTIESQAALAGQY